MMSKSPFFQRRNYFIKPSLQIRFIIFMVLASILTVGFIHITFEMSIMQLLQNMGVDIMNIKPSIATMRLNTVLIMVVIIGVVSALTVLYFHNFLGPLFALERTLDKIKEGDLTVDVVIRKDDQLKDIAGKIKQMVAYYHAHIKEDREKIQRIDMLLKTIIPQAKNNQLSPELIEQLASCQKDISQITQNFTI